MPDEENSHTKTSHIMFYKQQVLRFAAPIIHSHTREQLKDIGQDIAMGYGGECINIERVVKKNTDGSMTVIEIR